MFTFCLNTMNIDFLYSSMKDNISKGENEFSIVYSDNNNKDDILSWNEQHFESYKNELLKITQLIKEEYEKDNILYINVLTELITTEEVKLNPDTKEKFLFCKHCPCTNCNVNPEFFKQSTNVEFIPPVYYCKRSFVEYEVGINLIKSLQLNIKLEEINCKDYLELIFKAYGNDLGIGVDKFGL
jgi:hypothetical protein